LYARLLKHWIIKLRPRLGVSKTALVVTNQYRAPIGLYARPEPPGGKAWAHAVDVRLYLSTASKDKISKEGVVVGHNINVQVKKSKVSPPHTESKIKVEY
jgi:RecA/RadA recombinase